jgi:peroxiredoxin
MKKHLLTSCIALGLAFFISPTLADDSVETVSAPAKKANTRLGPGDVATDFTVIGPEGEEVRLSDFKGKVVMLDFWATWCVPCLKAMPEYSELAKARADDGLVILSICVADTREKYDQWVTDNAGKFAFKTAHDPMGKNLRESIFASKYGVGLLPSVFVVDREGKMVGRAITYPKEKSNLQELLDQAGLNEAPEPPKPGFRTSLGKLKEGDAMRQVTVETQDGASVQLSELAAGSPFVLRVFKAPSFKEEEIADLNAWAEQYADQGLKVIGLGAYTDRATFDEWMAANGDQLTFPVVFDPVGPAPKAPKPRDEMSDEELAAYSAVRREHYGKVVPMTLAGGLMAPVPHTIVMDSNYQFLGIYVGAAPETMESLGNLLLRAGIDLQEEDRPSYVFSAAETAPPPPEEKVEIAKAGQPAPDFTAIDIDGNEVKISDYLGKVVVLDFWASWCGPCMKAMPHLQDVATKYRDQGVVVLGSSTRDARKNFEKWIKANASKYPDIIWAHDPADKGPKRASRALYGVAGIPTQFVIGRDGKIAAVTIGYLPGEVLVDAALAKAGIDVPEEILAKAKEDLKNRQRMQ